MLPPALTPFSQVKVSPVGVAPGGAAQSDDDDRRGGGGAWRRALSADSEPDDRSEVVRKGPR